MNLKHVLCAVAMSAGVLAATGQAFASSAGLVSWASGESLYTIDETGPSGTVVGISNFSAIIAEIEYGNGVIYGADTGDNTQLHIIDPATNLSLGTIIMNFPDEGNVVTSLEFIGDTLYAGLTTEGGGETFLSTIDLDTGDVTPIGGPTFVGTPFGGLAWDGSTLYGVSAGGSGSLYTLSLFSGAASLVDVVRDATGADIGMTALEFGTDGVLYGLANLTDPFADHLLVIDPATAIATDLGEVAGPLGDPLDQNALTSVPEPSTVALLVIPAALLLVTRRRR